MLSFSDIGSPTRDHGQYDGSHMLRSIVKVLLPGLLLLCLATPAIAQQASTAITIDANRLDTVLTLLGPFPTQTTDDPRFADPTFDDAAWPQLKANQPIAVAHLKSAARGYAWVRIHLHTLNAHGPLAIAIGHAGYSYTVYANGRQIANSAGMASSITYDDPPFTIALPPVQDITLAIRFNHHNWLSQSPLRQLQIGQESAVLAATELSRIHDFDLYMAAGLILGLTLVAFAAFFFVLYLAQRQRSEYLWLALYCLCVGVYYLVNTGQTSGTIPVTIWSRLLLACCGFYLSICSLEFVIRFVRAKAHWLVRLLEFLLLLGPLEVFFPARITNYCSTISLILTSAALGYFLIRAFRSGSFENKLLLPPFALVELVAAWSFLPSIFPRVYFPPPFLIGRIGVDVNSIATFIFLTAILAVVLYRFIRVTRDEQRAAAELEAARTVQQILIPETLPSIPGYTIASVYQPAQEVGGDFFQIIPVPNNAALIILGDVSGKGMQAAMTVSLLVGALRAAAEITASPAELLANLNRRLHGRGTGFTTCLILHFTADGHLTAANAGHLQPYLDGEELALEPGLPLGFIPDATYPESHLALAPNQTLTLLTDGLVEATSPTKELFGFDRTQSISHQSAHDIAAAATAFGETTPQADDITVLTLHRLPA
jgi:hypothetical protein